MGRYSHLQRPDRYMHDDTIKAKVVSDYYIMGASRAAKRWDISINTLYNLLKRMETDKAFADLVADIHGKIRERIFSTADEALMASLQTLIFKLRNTEANTLTEHTNAVVQLGKFLGLHEGDNKGNEADKTGGRAIMLPAILTTPREDKGNE